jgi:hypothetical protein
VSIAHLKDAHTITLIVSWNDAEASHESVSFAIFVSHKANLLHLA